MLNISKNSINKHINFEDLQCLNRNELPKSSKMFAWWLIALLVLVLIFFFLPWTQNIQMQGKVTTLLPSQRPQKVNAVIDGKIEKWFVQEGDLVAKGDTIVHLSEIKADYLDIGLIGKTENQVKAKANAINSYDSKAKALENQINALEQEKILKKEQLKQKIEQNKLKIQSIEAEITQANLDLEIANFQLKRTDTLYQKGIKALTDVEDKRLKVQKTSAKQQTLSNKLNEMKNELNINELSFQTIENEYNNKIAKAESDKFSTLSDKFNAVGSLNKLENSLENYNQRNKMYYILAPQDGYITKTVKSGIGEIIKASDSVLTIVPAERELAVEMYVSPIDLPLIDTGQAVNIIFDGWQAFIISGWSNISFGTFEGVVVAIDNVPNEKNKYRLLIQGVNNDFPFPDLLRVGTGAKGVAMLKTVPVWYEVWRQLNGFPADFYDNDIEHKEKFKPPVKAVAK